MDEFATVKSAFPSVVTHSEAEEFHSLFCTMYAPPETEAVCEAHSVVVAAWAVLAKSVRAAAAASVLVTAMAGASRRSRLPVSISPLLSSNGLPPPQHAHP